MFAVVGVQLFKVSRGTIDGSWRKISESDLFNSSKILNVDNFKIYGFEPNVRSYFISIYQPVQGRSGGLRPTVSHREVAFNTVVETLEADIYKSSIHKR